MTQAFNLSLLANKVNSSGQLDASTGLYNTSALGFASGTRMSFQQTNAPTGWTKQTATSINDAILRLVTGTVSNGGSTAFSTWNAGSTTGATTLSTSQIPSHNHSNGLGSGQIYEACSTQNYGPGDTGFTGGGGSHTHSLTQNIKYFDFIIAQKD